MALVVVGGPETRQRASRCRTALVECGTGKSRSAHLRLVPMHSSPPSPHYNTSAPWRLFYPRFTASTYTTTPTLTSSHHLSILEFASVRTKPAEATSAALASPFSRYGPARTQRSGFSRLPIVQSIVGTTRAVLAFSRTSISILRDPKNLNVQSPFETSPH